MGFFLESLARTQEEACCWRIWIIIANCWASLIPISELKLKIRTQWKAAKLLHYSSTFANSYKLRWGPFLLKYFFYEDVVVVIMRWLLYKVCVTEWNLCIWWVVEDVPALLHCIAKRVWKVGSELQQQQLLKFLHRLWNWRVVQFFSPWVLGRFEKLIRPHDGLLLLLLLERFSGSSD
jgi:hypothetical protein